MAWLLHETPPQATLAETFRRLVSQAPPILRLPGTPDALAALIARSLGFSALYLSGAAYAASRGWPDLGLTTSSELAERARDIVRASRLPVLVDIDTGFGGVINVARTAREMVEAGVAAVQIEDQALPKKCGHLSGKTLIPAEEMAQKIRMLKQVAPTLVVVARTDAAAVEGLPAAAERARRYLQAGADAIFPEALTGPEEFRQMAAWISAPLLANMTEFGKTPYTPAETFEAWGYRMVIYPVSALRLAARAYQEVFLAIRDQGGPQSLLNRMQTRRELYELIGYFDYEALDAALAASELPATPPPPAEP